MPRNRPPIVIDPEAPGSSAPMPPGDTGTGGYPHEPGAQITDPPVLEIGPGPRAPVTTVDRRTRGPIVNPRLRGRKGSEVRWPQPPRLGKGSTGTIAPSPRATQNALRQGRNRTMTFRDSEGLCVPLVYGLVRCGARIVYARTDNANRFMYVVYLFCEGQINSITNILIDKSTPEQLGLVLNSTYRVYLGTSSQTVDPIISGFDANWVSGHPGTAYMTAKFDGAHPLASKADLEAIQATIQGTLVRDPRTDPTLVGRYYRSTANLAHADLLTNNRYGANWQDAQIRWSGSWTESANDCDASISSRPFAPTLAPTVAAVVDTVNYSPLFNTYRYEWVYTWVVNGVESPPSPASTSYTYDLNTDFKRLTVTLANGPGGTTAKRIYRAVNPYPFPGFGPFNLEGVISDNTTTSFTVVLADSQLTHTNPPPSAPVPRYGIGIWMGDQATLDDWNETFRATYAGFLTYDGAYDCWVDKARATSALTFDTSNIIGEPEIETLGLAQLWSKVTVNFTNTDAGFKNDRATVEHPNLALPPNENEREEKREGDFRLFSVPTYDQAMRLAKLKFNRARQAKKITFITNAKGVRALPGLVVQVTHPVGPLSNTLVTITGVTPLQGGELWQLVGEFYSAANYSDVLQINPSPIIPGVPSPFTTPPNPTGVVLTEVITQLTNGQEVSRVRIDWVNATTPWYRATRITVDDGAVVVSLADAANAPVYFDSPRFNALHTVILKTVTITDQLSPGVTATITPTLNFVAEFSPPLGRIYDSADAGGEPGTAYWDAPLNFTFGPTYDSTHWTNNGFPGYVGANVNNRSFTGTAFALNSASDMNLVLDVGVGITKDFRGVRISSLTVFEPNDHLWFSVQYSDNGSTWNDIGGSAAIDDQNFTPDSKDYIQTWSGVGTHRYWRLRRNGEISFATVVEVQFLELGSGDSPSVDHYELWSYFGKDTLQLMSTIAAAGRPTLEKPLNLMAFAVPDGFGLNPGPGAMIFVTSVNVAGVKSAWYPNFISIPVNVSGYTRIQASTTPDSTLAQPGSTHVGTVIGQERLQSDGMLTLTTSALALSNGDNNNIV